jgi:hypothetical protein
VTLVALAHVSRLARFRVSDDFSVILMLETLLSLEYEAAKTP